MHTHSCASATSRQCRCVGCGGSRHGWPGYLLAARPDQTVRRERLRRDADDALAQSMRRMRRKRPTFRRKEALVRGACADIVDWLAQQIADPAPTPAAASDILCNEIGQLLANPVVRAIDEALSEATRHDTRKILADHFFCDLLAQFAHAIDQLGQGFDCAVDEIVAAIVDSRRANRRPPLDEFLVRLAAKTFSSELKAVISRLSLVGQLKEVQRATQIMAVLICPAPERHREVTQYCLAPLETPVVTDVIRQQLMAALPEWMTPNK